MDEGSHSVRPCDEQQAIEFDRSLLRAIQEASPDAILVVNGQRAIVSFNQRFLDTWHIDNTYLKKHQRDDGSVVEEKLMRPAIKLLKDPDAFLARVEQLYADSTQEDLCEIELNDSRVLERHSVGLKNQDNQYLGRVWFFRDITSRKALESNLRHRASIDTLTGEMNRRHFFTCAKKEFLQARDKNLPLAILMIDLDHFKSVNDNYGHAAGDTVLELTCKRWRNVLRSRDILGRVGGEEFAVLVPQGNIATTRAVAQRLSQAIRGAPFDLDGQEIFCSISVGFTLISPDDATVKDALSRADEALYQAKNAGRDCIKVL